jgi:hypothetical protein
MVGLSDLSLIFIDHKGLEGRSDRSRSRIAAESPF